MLLLRRLVALSCALHLAYLIFDAGIIAYFDGFCKWFLKKIHITPKIMCYSSPTRTFKPDGLLIPFCMYFLPTAGESTKEAPPEAEAPLDSPSVQRDGTAVIA